MSTLNEFIGYVGLTDFCSEIWPKSNNTVQGILIFNFSRVGHSRNTCRMFLVSPTLGANISLANQKFEKA